MNEEIMEQESIRQAEETTDTEPIEETGEGETTEDTQETAEEGTAAPEETPEEVQEAVQEETGDSKEDAAEAQVLSAPLTLAGSPRIMSAGSAMLGATATAAEEETDEEYETLSINSLDKVKLGRQGEHLTQEVVIDCTAWLDKLSGCTFLIAAQRPGETAIYLPTVTVANGIITWPIRDQDTACAGWGRAEVRAMQGAKIKKSAVFRTRIEPSIDGDETTPTTPPDWVQTILDAVAAAQASADAAAIQATAARTQATAAAQSAAAAQASAAEAAANTEGLRGWSLTKEDNDTVTLDYDETTDAAAE